MVRKFIKNNKEFYQCQECGYIYDLEELAQECSNWCLKNKSYNLEIIKKAISREEINKRFNIQNLLLGILAGFFLVIVFSKLPIQLKFKPNQINQNVNQQNNQLQNLVSEIQKQVFPHNGFKTKLVFGGSLKKMIDCGVIDLEKMNKLYNGKIPEYVQKLINGSNEPIVINFDMANYLLNIFWPLGLSNKTEFNKNIPFKENELHYLASTAGWWLGKEENGVAYFNKCEIIKLTKEQEKIVYEVAQNTFRPCCNNSTFAQDCNHGSALLGALELAASQGYHKDELYKLALQLNSFWFPNNYIKTAIYFKLTQNKNWQDVDPKEIMGYKYSSISGWIENVDKKLANLPNISSTGSGCGL